MLVRFSLNMQKEIVWSLPRTSLMLTMASPSGEVHTETLDQQQKWALSAAIQAGKLISETSPDAIMKLGQPVENSQPVAEAINTKVAAGEKDEYDEYAKKIEQNGGDPAVQAKEILKGKIISVRKEILNTADIRLLKVMLALESGGKKRKTVLALLNSRLTEISAQITASITDDSDPIQMPKQLSGLITYDDDVVELEEKTIEVDLSANPTMDDLFQSQ